MLLKLCKSRADERTCIEAEAYHDWILGTVAFERSEWEEALNRFRKTRYLLPFVPFISIHAEL